MATKTISWCYGDTGPFQLGLEVDLQEAKGKCSVKDHSLNKTDEIDVHEDSKRHGVFFGEWEDKNGRSKAVVVLVDKTGYMCGCLSDFRTRTPLADHDEIDLDEVEQERRDMPRQASGVWGADN